MHPSFLSELGSARKLLSSFPFLFVLYVLSYPETYSNHAEDEGEAIHVIEINVLCIGMYISFDTVALVPGIQPLTYPSRVATNKKMNER